MELMNFYLGVKVFGWGFGTGVLAALGGLALWIWIDDRRAAAKRKSKE